MSVRSRARLSLPFSLSFACVLLSLAVRVFPGVPMARSTVCVIPCIAARRWVCHTGTVHKRQCRCQVSLRGSAAVKYAYIFPLPSADNKGSIISELRDPLLNTLHHERVFEVRAGGRTRGDRLVRSSYTCSCARPPGASVRRAWLLAQVRSGGVSDH